MPGAMRRVSERGGEYPARGTVVITKLSASGCAGRRSAGDGRDLRSLTHASHRRLSPHGRPFLGVGPHRRPDPRDARVRSRRPRPHPPRTDPARGRAVVGRLRRHRRRLRAAGPLVRRGRVRRGVLRRLRHREEPLGRQPLRLRADHVQLRRPPAAAAEGAALRHHLRAGPAHGVHLRRGRRHRAVQLGLLPLRRLPGLDGDRPGPRRPPGGRGVLRERHPPAHPPVPADDGGVPRRPADDDDRRQAPHHPAGHRPGGHRQGRHPLRRRLHPGDLRADPGDLPGLRGERVLAAGPAAAVLPHRRPARPARVPALRAGRDPRLHRVQAAGPRAAHQRAAVRQRRRARDADPRDPHLAVARRDPRDPGGHDRRQPAEEPVRPVLPVCRLTAPDPREEEAARVQLPVWFEIATFVGLTALLLADLALVARRPHEPSPKESAVWVTFYVVLALLFGVVLLLVTNGEFATEFYAGWLTEYSLSVDNLFVFVIIMARFKVPRALQQEALMVGIIIALVLRGIFILLGAAVISRFTWVFYIFGAFLVYTAINLVRNRGEDEEYEENAVIRRMRKVLPLTSDFSGSKLRVTHDGKRYWTPLLVVFLALGTTDLLFALDSIPAIFGLTRHAFIVFTANVFALMGLRQLYFLLGGLLKRLVYLSLGLAVILAFIGVKLVLEAAHENSIPFINGGEPLEGVPTIPIWLSLTVILGVLVIATIASLLRTRRQNRTPALAVTEPGTTAVDSADEGAAEPRLRPQDDTVEPRNG